MKKFIYTIAAIAAAGFLSSCEEKLKVDTVDESAYDNVKELIASVRDGNNYLTNNVVELYAQPYATDVVVTMQHAPASDVNVTVFVDEAYVEEYNQIHGTSFEAFPAENITIENGGKTVIANTGKTSQKLALTLAPLKVKNDATYVVALQVAAEGVNVSEQHLVYLVKNRNTLATALRKPGEKSIFCYFEVNDTNPLNLLQWEMEDGRLLVDYLVLFAYNINYNQEKGEVYCAPNPQCQFILDNYDKMIKPLRDRGVKVIVGLLGNHDESGLAQLSPLGCKTFAAHMAAFCYGYGFDGINFDDEYSNSPDLNNPLFCARSYEAGDRLIYECKQAMPDLLMTSYQYGQCRGRNAVDGHEPGEYLDITVGDYGVRAVVFPGMSQSQCAYQSSEFAQQRYLPTESTLKSFCDSDYGYWMIFAPWGSSNQGGKTHFDELNILAKGLYNSELKKPTIYYPETRSLEPKAITW